MKLWIEDADAFPIRIEAEVIGDHSRMQKGTLLREDWMRLNDVWLPKALTLNYSMRVMKMFGAKGTADYTYTDYRKFEVESNIVEFKEKQ